MALDYSSTSFRGVIPFSGGIDSTAALYKTLTENPNEYYLIYRIQLINGTSGHRTIRESMAAEKILHWMEAQGINNFAFRSLSFDYSSLGMMPPVWDSEIINFVASVVVQAKPEIFEFIEGAIKDDYEDEGFEERLEKIAGIFYTSSGRKPENFKFIFPLKDMSKYEIMKYLPGELLALTWSCRYPEIGPPYTFVRCHKCPQCDIIDKIIDEHPGKFDDYLY